MDKKVDLAILSSLVSAFLILLIIIFIVII